MVPLLKTDIERLTEKLAEVLDTQELERLAQLFVQSNPPVIIQQPYQPYLKPSACGGWFFKEQGCETKNEFTSTCGMVPDFTDSDCINQGKFDWGKCRDTVPKEYTGTPDQSAVSTTHPPGNHCTDDFVCGDNKPYACANDTDGHVFQCDDGEFECEVTFNCYSGYECPTGDYTCEATFGCADPFQCPNTFTCKESHTCGEGEMGLDTFKCDTSLGTFDCGYEDAGEHGSFTCRDVHKCPGTFTCHLENSCGSSDSPDQTKFDCGTEGLPSTRFDCLKSHDCWDKFTCEVSHTCGLAEIIRKEDSFNCGNGGDVDTFKCIGSFDCLDKFACHDEFDCPDYFACGDGEVGDEFTCGNGEEWDRFTCGDGEPTDNFICNTNPAYGCTSQDPNENAFTCGSVEQPFECSTFVCHAQGGSSEFNCLNQFSCRYHFECGDEQGSTFNCGTSEQGDSFSCGAPVPGKKPSKGVEYVCHTAQAFSCPTGYHCPTPHRGFNCSGAYHCGVSTGGSGTMYNCGTEATTFTCNEPSGFDCNTDPEATFTCGTNGSTGQTHSCLIDFDCSQRFSCAGSHPLVQYGCPSIPSSYDCEGAKEFVCEGFYGCAAGHGCTGMFICAGIAGFECHVSINCNESTNFDCQLGFTCARDQFQCPGSYTCKAGAFGCDGVNGSGANQRFLCAEGTDGEFTCDTTAYDFTCGLVAPGEFLCEALNGGFICETQHIFTCSLPGVNSFTCNKFHCRPQGDCVPRDSFSCGGNPLFNSPGDFTCSYQHTCVQEVKCEGGSPGGSGDFSCAFDDPGANFTCETAANFDCNTELACFTQSGIGHFCPRGGFTCKYLGQPVGCLGVDAFQCPPSQTNPYECINTYDCGSNSHDCTNESGGHIFTCRLPNDPFTCGSATFNVSSSPGAGYVRATAKMESPTTLGQLASLVQRRSQITPDEANQLICRILTENLGVTGVFAPETLLTDLGIDVKALYRKLGYNQLLE